MSGSLDHSKVLQNSHNNYLTEHWRRQNFSSCRHLTSFSRIWHWKLFWIEIKFEIIFIFWVLFTILRDRITKGMTNYLLRKFLRIPFFTKTLSIDLKSVKVCKRWPEKDFSFKFEVIMMFSGLEKGKSLRKMMFIYLLSFYGVICSSLMEKLIRILGIFEHLLTSKFKTRKIRKKHLKKREKFVKGKLWKAWNCPDQE